MARFVKHLASIWIVLAACLCQGCFTYGIWMPAGDDKMPFAGIKAYVCAANSADAQRVDYLVASYHSRATWPRQSRSYAYAIPCPDGRIPERLIHQGPSRRYPSMLREISTAQKAEIKRCLTAGGLRKREAALPAGEYIESHAFKFVCTQGRNDWNYNIELIPFWLPRDGGPDYEFQIWRFSQTKNEPGNELLDEKCRVLILPAYLPKKGSDQAFNILLAILESPVTVPLDILLSPLVVPAMASVKQ